MIRRVAAILAIGQAALLAHSGEPLEPHDLWTAWRFEPGIVIPLVVSMLLYAYGARRARISLVQTLCFWSAFTTLVIALVSPLHALGEALFSAHMAQHEILMLVAAPLLVLARPLVPFVWGLPFEGRRIAGRWSKATWFQTAWKIASAPLSAWCIHAVALWTWHIPALFDATLTNEWIHAAQHLSFFLSALLFWWSLFYARGRSNFGAGVLYIFTTAIHTSILGALLTFARTPWYTAYGNSAAAWGLTPVEDQQIGGLIMWIPAGLVYLCAGLVLFSRWLAESELVARQKMYAD
jgi:putative membrane protein